VRNAATSGAIGVIASTLEVVKRESLTSDAANCFYREKSGELPIPNKSARESSASLKSIL
jgi:hypothetical protein